MSTPPIVSWHPVLTDHQSHTLLALENAANAKVTVMTVQSEDPTRKAQGWTRPDFSTLDVRLLNPRGGLRIVSRALREHSDCIHLFGSPFDNWRFMLALYRAVRMGLPVYLISEPYSPIAAGYLDDRRRLLNSIKARLRPWLYRLYGWTISERIQGVFAISPLAVAQYRAIGIPASKIYPFGYFVPSDRPPRPDQVRQARTAGCKAVFVGNLIVRKGLTELITAAKHLRASGVDLRIDAYGAGDPTDFDFDGEAVRYAGRIPFGKAQSVIADYDFLVLPSRYDGWGVVVNEAVQAGVPVICSDRVGAGAFVRKWGCGIAYPADSSDGLEGSLRSLATSPSTRLRMRDACLDSRHRLEPTVAGQYMSDVLGHRDRTGPPPPNPWYDC